jgi:hypothetical protein
MEPLFTASPSFPPPPPPQHSRKGLWIGLIIGAIVVCLCCITVVVVTFSNRQNIPILSSFFPSPTPEGLPYNNSDAGISLIYPVTWKYDESGDATSGYMVFFASSADILSDSSNAPKAGAAMIILTNAISTSDLSFPVDASSMGSVVDYMASVYFSNISGGQNLHNFTLSGLPAASGVYSMTDSNGTLSSAYIVTVLRNDEIILLFGVCPETEWAQNQPSFDSIINSAKIVIP